MKITIKQEIISYLKLGGKSKARSFILAQLDSDRFKPIMLISLKQHDVLAIDDLFDSDIEVEPLPQEEWDRPYWTRMCVELSNNFSKEKLSHTVEVMTFLREQEDPKFIPSVQTEAVDNPKSISGAGESVNSNSFAKKTAIGTVAGGVIGAGLGAVIANTTGIATKEVVAVGIPSLIAKGAMIGGVIGAVVGAAVFYTIYKNKKL